MECRQEDKGRDGGRSGSSCESFYIGRHEARLIDSRRPTALLRGVLRLSMPLANLELVLKLFV